MSSPLIESTSYYCVSSDHYGPSVLLSNGMVGLFLTSCSISSNNWQIFYQNPIYLIRNLDLGAKYQLGIAEDSPTQPELLLASGDLTQQWNMTLWDDGTFRLANMWLGSAQILGISSRDNVPVPAMTAAQNGSHWSFSVNLSIPTSNLTNDMLQPVSLQAVR